MSQEQKPIRTDSIYVSYVVRKGLSYVPRTENDQTVDGLADEILLAWLKDHHPAVLDHIKAQREADNEFKKRMAKPNDNP